MRRSGVSVLFFIPVLLLLAYGLAGCGGTATSGTPGAPAYLLISPASVTLAPGQTQQMTATVYDINNNVVPGQTFTWISTDTTILTVSPSGLVCAGAWNPVYTVCTAGPTGTPYLTATTSTNIAGSEIIVVGSGTVGGVAVVTITPSPISINRGAVLQVTGIATDAQGNTVGTETITFTSSNTSVLTTSPSGLLCGGIWDSNFIHCTPGPVGTSSLTATATPSNVTSSAVTVYVHDKADSIVVGELSPVPVALACGVPALPPPGCVSMGASAPNNTASYTAIACSSDPAVCAPNPTPCQLPAATLGAFTFTSSNALVVTVAPDTSNPQTVAVATAKGPGVAQIVANLSQTTSLPAQFTTCPPQSINIHVQNQPTTTTVSLAAAATSTLVADAVDTNGVSMTSAFGLTWSSSLPKAASVGTTGVVTGVGPGTTNIVASCGPPTCNVGTGQAIYSNVVTASVTGTANATTLYVTSSDSGTTTLIPISTSNNTVGTAINLPAGFPPPNSFIFSADGSKGFLGTDAGLIIFDPVALNYIIQAGAKGRVLAASPNNDHVIVADTTGLNNVYIYNIQEGTISTYSIAGATAADFTPDSNRAFIGTSAGRIYEIASGTFANVSASGPVSDVALLASGAFAYAADPGTDMFSTCTNTLSGSATADTPTLIRAAAKPLPAPNNTNLQMISVVGSTIEQIDVVPGAVGSPCPAAPSNTANPYSFPGVAAFTPVQLLVTPDSSRAIVTASDVNKLLVYSLGATPSPGTPSTIQLAGAATGSYTAAVTQDSATVYVGVAGSNEVQVFTLSSGALVTEIPVSVSPKLIAIRNQ